jgi:SSS family solute:Na+ symporter
MQLAPIDIGIIIVYGIITFILGIWYTRRAGKSMEEYFVAGRSLPWWIAGTSIAVTWFASDAPLAVASFVRQDGIFGSWLWWYEAAGVMIMVFFFAKLWRRSEVLTDAEFIELRYSGKEASVLRGFTAIYHGILRNCIVMGWVMLAMMKFSQVLLGWDPLFTLVVCVIIAVVYTFAAGLWGVVSTDMFQFVMGFSGSAILAGIVVHEYGGIKNMSNTIRELPDVPPGVLDIMPQYSHLSPLEFASFFCLIVFLWARSGQGDGYIAQRLFATKNEKQSVLASFWFSILGVVFITWPWILVGMGSLIMFPLGSAPPELLADPELAYPMMLAEFMPTGLKGLLVAAFLAAFMSTMDTHLCWGGSYMINDVYRRFMVKDKSEKHYVLASRISIIFLIIIAAFVAWQMQSIERAWIYIIELMSGIAVVWMMRWYWWRVNAWAEISSMLASIVVANGHLTLGLFGDSGFGTFLSRFYGEEFDNIRAVCILLICTLTWVITALLTKPTSKEKLDDFYRKIRPEGFWKPVADRNPDVLPDQTGKSKWLGFFFGSLFMYGAILGIGYFFTGRMLEGAVLGILSAGMAWISLSFSKKVLSS